MSEKLASCNCNDEFITIPCPIHGESKENFRTGGKREVQIITDADLFEYGTYTGFKFVCRFCNVPSVMVNEYMGKYCCSCGRECEIRSKTVTDFIRSKTKGVKPHGL